MMLASLLLASTLSQPYPPPSRYAPPPCVVARVPGCREGYRMRHDAHGRAIFVYDPSAAADQPLAAPPAQPPGQYIPEGPPVYAEPAPVAPAMALPGRSRGQLGFVWMPLGGTSLGNWDGQQEWYDKYAGLIALELRGSTGGGRLRFLGEYGPVVRVAEIGLKYDFNDQGVLRPFLGVGVGAARLDSDYGFDPGWRAALSGSIGFDFFLTRNLFFTGELKGRGFLEHSYSEPSSSNVAQLAAFFGAGIYFWVPAPPEKWTPGPARLRCSQVLLWSPTTHLSEAKRMDGKKMRAAVLTEGVVQAALRRGSARELDSEEEKVMRMRLGADLPSSGKLERVGTGFTDTEIELLSYEIEAWLELRDQGGQSRVSQPVPVASRAKEKIIRALRRKN